MKNLSLILNAILLAAVGFLYYKVYNTGTPTAAVIAPSPAAAGVKIAYINADTLDAQYNWLKEQKAQLEQRLRTAESSMAAKKEALMKDAAAFQEKAQTGTVARAELEKEYAALEQRQQKLGEEEMRLSKQLAEQNQKAMKDLMVNVETKLKSLQSQVGYDYILSYSKGGGQVLLANDSLDITKQVLELLNAKQ
jgi:outer membrane protein